MTTDVILNKDKSYWDFDWDSSGDISTDQKLEPLGLIAL